MTISDPTADRGLLTAVVATEHDRLDALLVEASRDTDTPGVRDDLTAGLGAELIRHLNAEVAVLHPEVGEVFGASQADQLLAEARALVEQAGALHDRIASGEFEAALRLHRNGIERILARLLEAEGAERMAGLGHEFIRVAEVASPTRLTDPADGAP
jgi:hypothetical protein